MVSFSIHFLSCNILIGIIIGGILLAKKLLKKYLSPCSQYRIWLLLPVILTVPFLPVRPTGFWGLMLLIHSIKNSILPAADLSASSAAAVPRLSAGLINDFSISVTGASAPAVSYIPLILWICGMLIMALHMIRSRICLYHIEHSALPLQNRSINALYLKCKANMRINRHIPIYSTAFLTTPAIVGMFCPRIYIPIRLISDLHEREMRYMLLHELQHYKHKDAFLNCLMNLAAVVYWFNPVVWYALKEAKSDREISCDTCVLQMLDAREYIDYGNTLLNFARKTALSPFSLTTGIGGSTAQIRKRIMNIASYEPKDKGHKIKERILFIITAVLILESTGSIPTLASETKVSLPKGAAIHTDDLSNFFAGREGCFVLYYSDTDSWEIYNETLASKRFSPDSTYKIYSALSALENRYISPSSSTLKWNGQISPFSEWNRDQTLTSAMQNSVNWYFQKLDQRSGPDALAEFYHTIEYGNQDLSGGTSTFWQESSLKISALEQVELLKNFYNNTFYFEEDNVQAVKDALKLSASGDAILSGKTGTGSIDGKNVNGWFIGYVESDDNTCFFATNVQGPDHADGQTAANITLNILEAKHIYASQFLFVRARNQ